MVSLRSLVRNQSSNLADYLGPLGSCTIVIANLNLFPPMDLPEPPRGPFKYSDISTFEELYGAAQRVDQHCLAWLRQAGYQETGKKPSPFAHHDC